MKYGLLRYKTTKRGVMRFIVIIINMLSKYAVQKNNVEDFIGELE